MLKEIFEKLSRSKSGKDYSPIWNVYEQENIRPALLEEIIDKYPVSEEFQTIIKHTLQKTKTKNESLPIIHLLLRDESLSESFWEELYIVLRDFGCKNVQLNPHEVIKVKCAGDEFHLGIEELDFCLLEDFPAILGTQTAIPETILLQDDREILMKNLKRLYEQGVQNPTKLSVIKNSAEARRLNDIRAEEAELFVQEKLLEVGKYENLVFVVLRGIKTHQNVGRHLEAFGIKLSKLSNLVHDKENVTADLEAEHDILAITFNEGVICVMFIQVKTSVYNLPWIENPDDQHLRQFSNAKRQLQRDILRFSELLPDIKFLGKIKFKFFVAFPFYEEEVMDDRKNSILTRPDLASTKRLFQKLDLKKNEVRSNEIDHLFKTLVGRYIGLHSTIPLKNTAVTFTREHNLMRSCLAKTEAAFHSSVTPFDNCELEIYNLSPKQQLENEKVTKDILRAMGNKTYRDETFKKLYKSYPVDEKGDLDIKESKKDEKYPLKRKSSSRYVVVGKESFQIIFRYLDVKLGHQGFRETMKKMKEEKIEVFDIIEFQVDSRKRKLFVEIPMSNIETYLGPYFECEHCKLVELLKTKGKFDGSNVNLKDTSDILLALKYGDLLHKGYHEALHRLKNWCNFDNMEQKIRDYCNQCSICSQKYSCILLSKQQLKAIQNKNFILKILTGPFGTGKTTIGKVILEEKQCYNNYFVVMSETEGPPKLKSFFQDQFDTHDGSTVRVFSRNEIIKYCGIEKSHDDLEIIEDIVGNLRPNSAIFFDETPIIRANGSYDWSNLKIQRNDVLVVISFQPLIESSKSKNTRPIRPLFPEGASKIELNKVYRTSNSIFKSLQSLQFIGIKRMDCLATPNNLVIGKKPVILTYKAFNDISLIRRWIKDYLNKLNCTSEMVSILYTKNTEIDAKRFSSGTLLTCLNTWKEFRGCENSVIICFYSSDDETWQLMTMASRAQQQLFILNRTKGEDSVCAEIENVQHYSFEDLKVLFPSIILISSPKPKADQIWMLGFYQLSGKQREGRDVYVQKHDQKDCDDGGNPCKILSHGGMWMVTYNDQVRLRATAPSKTPLSAKWEYFDLQCKIFREDPEISITYQSELPTCKIDIKLCAFSSERMLKPQIAGIYNSFGTFCRGRPYLIHSSGDFSLSVLNGYWKVRSRRNKGYNYLWSNKAPSLCPALNKQWQFVSERSMDWVSSDISVTCIKCHNQQRNTSIGSSRLVQEGLTPRRKSSTNSNR